VDVRGEPLTGGAPREELEEEGQLPLGRQEFLDPGDGDVDPWSRRREPVVALVLDEDDAARLGDQEVRSAHADRRLAEHVSKLGACLHRQLGRVLRIGSETLSHETPSDVNPVLMDDRGHDVAGVISVDLNDVLAQIGFDGAKPRAFERGVEADLFGRHRLGLGHDRPRLGHATTDLQDDPIGFSRVRGPVDLNAPCGGARLELQKEVPQSVEDLILDPRCLGSGRFDIVERFPERRHPRGDFGGRGRADTGDDFAAEGTSERFDLRDAHWASAST